MKETWRPVKGYEDYYTVSSFGKVVSLRNDKVLKYSVNHKGYFIVQLSKEGVKKNYRVHRLVAQTYIPNPDNLPEVDHINGDRQDNRIENLRWASPSSNTRNRDVCRKSSSKYNGVYYQDSKWVAIIRVNRKNVYLGAFKCERFAALTFNKYCLENNLNRELNILEVVNV